MDEELEVIKSLQSKQGYFNGLKTVSGHLAHESQGQLNDTNRFKNALLTTQNALKHYTGADIEAEFKMDAANKSSFATDDLAQALKTNLE